MIAAGFVTDEGKADRGRYALRHTYATMALRAGLPTFTVARRLGSSVQMIEATYGHLAEDANRGSWSASKRSTPNAMDAPWTHRARSSDAGRPETQADSEALFRPRTGDPLLTMRTR
jgi:hypothetical protein